MLLTIDPGADSGWAVFGSTGWLTACGLNEGAPSAASGITRVVIERPHPHRTKAKVKDIITLALRAGEWGGWAKAVLGVSPEYIEPPTWKGSMDKDTCHSRMWALLSPNEKILLAKAGDGIAPSKQHNICDAVAIGLWVKKRNISF